MLSDGSSFGDWLRHRRRAFDLTRDELARQVGCAAITIRKLESEERRPSKQIADRLADIFQVEPRDRVAFLRFARGDPLARPGCDPDRAAGEAQKACANLAEVLVQHCPQLSLLATSREALGVAGEGVFDVPSLSVPAVEEQDLTTVARSEAVRPFVGRAAAVRPEFTLTAANAPTIGQVCRRLDGVPLALELAAARVRLLEVEEIALRLDDAFRFLTGGSRTALPRQQTLQATLAWMRIRSVPPDCEERLRRCASDSASDPHPPSASRINVFRRQGAIRWERCALTPPGPRARR